MPDNTNQITASIPILGKVSISFYGIAEQVLDLYKKRNEFDRQKDIHHLGLISRVFEGASHTRYEYVMLQAGLTDLLDNITKGSSTASQGSLKVNKKKISGNALIKSWLLLSNFGHTRNTIGDEKSLLLFALQQPGFKTQLLSPIRDTLLRSWAEAAIKNFNYTAFHHILSIRRIYKEMARQVQFHDKMAILFKLLLVDTDIQDVAVNKAKLEQLRRIFNTIRALAIVTIDGHYSHQPISIDLVSTILSIDNLENSYKDIFLLESVTPILSTLHENIYLDRDVLAKQRDYEIRALAYLNSKPKNNISYEQSIQLAMKNGLVNAGECSLKPFARFPITQAMRPEFNFYEEFRGVQHVKRGCTNIEASLDLNPITKTRYADFYINSELFESKNLPRFVYNICLLISQQIKFLIETTSSDFEDLLMEVRANALASGLDEETLNSVLEKSNRTIVKRSYERFKGEVFPSYKDLLWSILTYFIGARYHIDIETPQKQYDIFGMKLPAGDIGLHDTIIQKAMAEESDNPDRLHELKQAYAASRRRFEGYVFTCLARVIIYDKTKAPSERLVSDIDSIIIKVSKTKLILELNEAKNYKKKKDREAKAIKEIRDNLVPVLTKEAKGYRVKRVTDYGGKLVITCKQAE